MKKLVILGAVVLAVVGVAYASSLTVPFFWDNAPTGWPVTSGNASFIGIHNNTGADISCEVMYISDQGVDVSPANKAFTLEANSSLSFRPCQNDLAIEGAGAAVPNMTAAGITATDSAGSAVISWTGGAKDIQGRMVQISASGSTDSSSYTLPEGQ